MVTLPTDIRDHAEHHYRAAQRAQRDGVSRSRTRASVTSWTKWLEFCAWLTLAPDLRDVRDPIPYLQIFADRIQVGELAAGGARVRKRTVEAYLRDVAQIFAGVGADDPRLDKLGHINFHLGWQLRCYSKADPPSK